MQGFNKGGGMKKVISYTILLICLLVLFACSPSTGTSSSPTAAANGQETLVANIVAQTLSSMVTDTPLFTLTPSMTLLPAITTTSTVPLISVSVDTNCRNGPGQIYNYLGGLMVGETTEVIARDPSGHYWYIQNPDAPGYCWVWGQYATITGDVGPLPVFTPEPTPTPVPDFTFAYHNYDMCVVNRYLEFSVTNTGMVSWESFSLTVRNITHSLTNKNSDNKFPDASGCGAEPPPVKLAPGETGIVGTTPFMDHNPSGDSFSAELTLCTQDNLLGLCKTKSINFTP
jgi:hypothetical protein